MRRCQRCGATKDLVVHHMDGVHGLVFPEATMILCRRCHSAIHRMRRDKVREYFIPPEQIRKRLKEMEAERDGG